MITETHQIIEKLTGVGYPMTVDWAEAVSCLEREAGEVIVEVPWVFEDGRFGRHELLLRRLKAGRVVYHNPGGRTPLPVGSRLPGNALISERIVEGDCMESLPLSVLRNLFMGGDGCALILSDTPL